MNWLPPNYRILYNDFKQTIFDRQFVYDKLQEYKKQGSLFCTLNGENVALVTDLEWEEKLKFTIYELKQDSLKNINSEEYYIALNISGNYIDRSLVDVSNLLTIMRKIK